MLEDINNLFKKIFSNEETLVFALLLTIGFLIIFFLGNILTPFLMSLIFAYLLIGMQKRLEQYGVNSTIALVLTYSFFLLLGIALMVWFGPLVYQQLQSLILEIPKWVNSFMIFVQNIILASRLFLILIVSSQYICSKKQCRIILFQVGPK